MKKQYFLFGGFMAIVLSAIAATAYLSRTQQIVNKDPAASATDMISTMSCIIRNTAADLEATAATPNPEPYLALVNIEGCQSISTTDGLTPNYSKYWVVPTFSNGALSVEAWDLNVNRKGYLKATINAGEKASPPYGEWSIDWCIERLADDTNLSSDPCAKQGHVSIDANQFYELYYRRAQSGSWTPYDKQSRGYVASSMKSGIGKYFERFNDLDSTVNQGFFAFEEGLLKDFANGTTVCKDPSSSAAGMKHQLWEAWLYDPTNQTLVADDDSEEAGFPVIKTSSPGAGSTGWAGYEGIRLSGSKASEQSGEFKRMNGNKATYTALGSYGRLIKHTPTLLPEGLRAIDRLVLQANLYQNAFANTLFSSAGYTRSGPSTAFNDRAKVLYYWDDTTGKFVFFARDKSSTGIEGKEFTPFSTPFQYSISELLAEMRASCANADCTSRRNWERSLWGFLKGSDLDHYIQLADAGTDDGAGNPIQRAKENVLVYRLDQKTVVPGSADDPGENLICIGKCPREAASNPAANKLQLEQVNAFSTTDPRASDAYVFSSTGDLKTAANNKTVKYEKVSGVDTYINRNGIDTQRTDFWFDVFVTASQLNSLKCHGGNDYCSYDTTSAELAQTNANETFGTRGLSHWYVWQSGNDRWTKFSGVKRADNSIVQMKPFKPLIYDVPDESSYGLWRGKKTSLKYVGNGQLWMPGHCENMVTGGSVSSACDQTNEWYVHDFIVPYKEDASAQSRVTDLSGNQFLVKWSRQGAYYPRHSDQSRCEKDDLNRELTRASNLVLPTSAVWMNPRTSMASRYPTVDLSTVLPKYIDGVRQ